jgi:hypothetical protein
VCIVDLGRARSRRDGFCRRNSSERDGRGVPVLVKERQCTEVINGISQDAGVYNGDLSFDRGQFYAGTDMTLIEG